MKGGDGCRMGGCTKWGRGVGVGEKKGSALEGLWSGAKVVAVGVRVLVWIKTTRAEAAGAVVG